MRPNLYFACTTFFFASLLAACSSEAIQSGDVVIETYDIYEARTARTRVDDPFEGEVSVLIPNADGYDVYADTEITAGRITVRGVPSSASYYVAYERTNSAPLFVEERDRDLENVDVYVGRPTTSAPANTSVSVSGTLARAWYEGTHLELFSERADVDRRVAADTVLVGQSGTPTVGAMSLTGFTNRLEHMDDPYGLDPVLIEAGDDLVVFTSEDVSLNGALPNTHPFRFFTYRTVTSTLTTTGVAFTGGAVTPITGTFTLPPERTVTFDVRTTAFTTALFANGAGGNPVVTVRIDGYAEPIHDGEFLVGHAGRLFETTRSASSQREGDVVTHPPDFAQEIMYTRPFGAGRVEMASVTVNLLYQLDDPVTGSSELQFADYTVYGRLDALTSGPITPSIGIPRNITIAGRSVPMGAADVTGVGLTPVIAWQAPANGRSALNRIEIIDSTDLELDAWSYAAFVRTSERTFRVPAGVLIAGHRYLVRVTVETEEDDLAVTSAEAVTGIFVP